MRKSALAGLFVFATIVAANRLSVSASALDLGKTNTADQKILSVSVLETAGLKVGDKVEAPVASPVKQDPQTYTVVADQTLSSIAEQYHTTWKRLFDKNEQIASPDLIKAGDVLTIPSENEELKERPLPEPPVQQPVAPVVIGRSSAPVAPRSTNAQAPVSRGASTGNTYSPGYCTWYAKNMRPDLPNNLGNADTWVYRAAAQGLATGSTPRAGAIGQQGMHVVYVQQVNSDGTVTISEMNYNGLYVISTRTVPAGTFSYIY